MSKTIRLCFPLAHAHGTAEFRLEIVVCGRRPAKAIMIDVVFHSCNAHSIVCPVSRPRIQRFAASGISAVPVAFCKGEDDVDLLRRGWWGECVQMSHLEMS